MVKKYNELVSGLKSAETSKDKLDILGIMVCMIATNDLEHAQEERKKIRKELRKTWVVVGGLATVVILNDVGLLKMIIELVCKVL